MLADGLGIARESHTIRSKAKNNDREQDLHATKAENNCWSHHFVGAGSKEEFAAVPCITPYGTIVCDA